ncbi:Kelch-like protein 17 [Eumeta japonica]|uniref:Kelch-like protein 17 n=1 Tax=Eumeta variegata TaxID=151549 RepID=A0A4C1VVS2_EUMVA|nr:Kelch-like protein 17 [Eumeta japonica]
MMKRSISSYLNNYKSTSLRNIKPGLIISLHSQLTVIIEFVVGPSEKAREGHGEESSKPAPSHYSLFNVLTVKAKRTKMSLTKQMLKKGSDISLNSATQHCPKYKSPGSDYVTSSCSEQTLLRKGDVFPFKTTPSGNLKIRTSQVVFQSSTVGVLLADPTQAKVKIRFEGKSSGEHENQEINDSPRKLEPQEDIYLALGEQTTDKVNLPEKYIDEKGKNLNSLGYALSEPIDWLRVQLPKKQDLYQEFYRRIHKFINTDTVVHIGNERFNCHRIVLQIYSSYFDSHPKREIELPSSNITPAAFKAIYEWMTLNGADCCRILRRRNILDLFTAAQFLAIKDLEEQCWSFMSNDSLFTEDTAFALLREAKAKEISSVVELMVPRVMRFFLPLVASSDYLELKMEEILILLTSNYICVTSELEVLMAGVRWLYGDWNSRREHVADVMRCVRFGLISPWQLVDLKRNPENAEILEIVNTPEVQEMIDDGLAYVIIKYWYGNDSKNYQHWIDVLGLKEPAERNWIGEEKNHMTHVEFLKYLDQFRMPKDQMYQKMAMMQLPRRTDVPPGQKGIDGGKDVRKLKLDFPLPDNLKKLTCEGSFPNMSQFFESRMKNQHSNPKSPLVVAPNNTEVAMRMKVAHNNNVRRSPDSRSRRMTQKNNQALVLHSLHTRNTPRRDTAPNGVDGADTLRTESMSLPSHIQYIRFPSSVPANCSTNVRDRDQDAPGGGASAQNVSGSQISIFDSSKESSPNFTKNKLSTSILGPSNRNYISDGSLFNWDKETVLVFGGTDPHSPYDPEKNSGRDIYRSDPICR